MRFKPRHQYDDKVDKEIGDSCATINNEPSLTQQQFTRQADVNEIVRRFAPGMDPGAVSIPTDPRAYGDLTHAPTSLRDVLDIRPEGGVSLHGATCGNQGAVSQRPGGVSQLRERPGEPGRVLQPWGPGAAETS